MFGLGWFGGGCWGGTFAFGREGGGGGGGGGEWGGVEVMGVQCIRRRLPNGLQNGSWSYNTCVWVSDGKFRGEKNGLTASSGHGSHLPKGRHMTCRSGSDVC